MGVAWDKSDVMSVALFMAAARASSEGVCEWSGKKRGERVGIEREKEREREREEEKRKEREISTCMYLKLASSDY